MGIQVFMLALNSWHFRNILKNRVKNVKVCIKKVSKDSPCSWGICVCIQHLKKTIQHHEHVLDSNPTICTDYSFYTIGMCIHIYIHDLGTQLLFVSEYDIWVLNGVIYPISANRFRSSMYSLRDRSQRTFWHAAVYGWSMWSVNQYSEKK